MQKSAHTNIPARRPTAPAGTAASDDKGQKFEPFWSLSLGSDRRSLARQLKADQKR